VRVPAVAFVLGAIVSIQFGRRSAATLFDELDASAVSLMRLGFAAVVLLAVWRPRVRAYAREDLRLALVFGLCLGAMNFTFYEAIERIDLGIAVTLEFLGPLGVAVAGSRSRRDLVWVALAAAGVLLLANPGGADAPDAVGVVFALLAAAFWAAYILLAARAGERFRGARGSRWPWASRSSSRWPGPGHGWGRPAQRRDPAHRLRRRTAVERRALLAGDRGAAAMPKNVFGVMMSLEPGRCRPGRLPRAQPGPRRPRARGDRARRRRQRGRDPLRAGAAGAGLAPTLPRPCSP
jgi:inner membrane transporter RhtA